MNHVVKQAAALCVTALALSVLLAACKNEESDAPNGLDIEITGVPRTTICHATGSPAIPYVEVAISDEALAQHEAHPNDLIPTPAEGCPDTLQANNLNQGAGGESAPGVAFSGSNPQATALPTQPPAAGAAPTHPPTAVPQCAPDQTIGTLIQTDPSLSQFTGMMQSAGWMDVLNSAEMTLFIPTNEALERVPDDLFAEWTETESSTNALLLYHLASGVWTAEQLAVESSLETISGENLRISLVNSDLVLDGDTRVVHANLRACNGVIHVVDDILVPPIFNDRPRTTPTPRATFTTVPTSTRIPATSTSVPTNPPVGSTQDSPPPRATNTAIVPTAVYQPPTATTIVATNPAQPTLRPTDPPPATNTAVPPTSVPPTATSAPTTEPTDPPPTETPGSGTTDGSTDSGSTTGGTTSGTTSGGDDGGSSTTSGGTTTTTTGGDDGGADGGGDDGGDDGNKNGNKNGGKADDGSIVKIMISSFNRR